MAKEEPIVTEGRIVVMALERESGASLLMLWLIQADFENVFASA